jgi:predicted GIY-YIG superfamily endonuclease
MPEWSVYMIRCGDGSLYTGISTDVGRRLSQHRRGLGAAYTRGRGPLELLWSRACVSGSEARQEEARLKKLSRAEKLALIGFGPESARP